MKLTVTKISYPTGDSVTLRFIKVKELETYRPGQHAVLNFFIQGQRFRRTYSFHTVSELDDDAAITIRTITDGKVSSFLRHAVDFATLPPRQISLSWKNNDSSFVETGESILQAALRNNLRVPYSCTEGQCGTCRSALVSGEIKLRKNYSLTEEELKAGQILLCQGFPASDNVVISVNNN